MMVFVKASISFFIIVVLLSCNTLVASTDELNENPAPIFSRDPDLDVEHQPIDAQPEDTDTFKQVVIDDPATEEDDTKPAAEPVFFDIDNPGTGQKKIDDAAAPEPLISNNPASEEPVVETHEIPQPIGNNAGIPQPLVNLAQIHRAIANNHVQAQPIVADAVGGPNIHNLSPKEFKPLQPVPKKVQKPWTLATSDECANDVLRVCSQKRAAHDLEVLACLSDAVESTFISDDCQHIMWEFKVNVTKYKKFDTKVFEYCGEIMKKNGYVCHKYEIGSGKIIPCMLNHLDDIGMKNTMCSRYLNQFASIIFADYRLICDFVENCQEDIKRGKCGKLESGDFRDMKTVKHSQGKVIACLEERLTTNQTVSHDCAKQIYRLSELQADDYNMDRHLYLSCREDREELCEKVVAGGGAVYECLFKHKFDRKMSDQCRGAITIRQKLISQDYRVNYRVHQSCAREIAEHSCMQDVATGVNDQKDHVGLSTILLCIENAKLNGERIDSYCDSALNSFRKQLLQDYEISPEIVHGCADLISAKCGNGIQKEGVTLHCLMNNVHQNPDEYPNCGAALLELVKETDVENDFQLDMALAAACQPVIQTSCKLYEPTDVAMLSCLLDRLHTPNMNSNCEQKLIDIQYFLGRDFFIDQHFNTACRKDAFDFCSVSDMGDYNSNTKEGYSPMPMELVLSCLHRYMTQYQADNNGRRLSEECEGQVNRILRTRALDYQLNPVLEDACRRELGKYCSEAPPKKGEELRCLQQNYEKLKYKSKCQLEIQRLTNWESEAAEDLESVLIRECEKMLTEFCQDLLRDKNDEETVMECLIRNKPNMDSKKCVAGVEHFQLIEMKDYNFDSKFVKHCKADVEQHCAKKEEDGIQTKADVIKCLSKYVRDAVLSEAPSRISPECRAQLTVEKLELHENILLNPSLRAPCEEDRVKFCSSVKAGEARVIQCLRKHKRDLRKECRVELFKFQKEEVGQIKLDFQLMRACKRDLKTKCIDKLKRNDRQLMMECLVQHKSELEKNCRKMVVLREMEMFDDINLNPDLLDNCKAEISSLCEEEVETLKSQEEEGVDPTGIVYSCLKAAFINDDDMSDKCRRHVLFVIQEQEENYELDPKITLYCIEPINRLCQPNNEVECLKAAYFDNKLSGYPICMKEVANILMEGRSDINADPVLLEKCGSDVENLCRSVVEGGGKKIKCLIDYDIKEPGRLDAECREELRMRRMMWDAVSRNDPKGLQDMAELVRNSKHSDYLILVLSSVMFMVLLMGIVFGRATKRQHIQLKNR